MGDQLSKDQDAVRRAAEDRGLILMSIRFLHFEVQAYGEGHHHADPKAVLTGDETQLFPAWHVNWFGARTLKPMKLSSSGQYPSVESALDAIRADFDVLDAARRLGA